MWQFNKRKQCCHTHIVRQYCFLLHLLSRHCVEGREELVGLFQFRRPEEAEAGWSKCFSVAKESGIPALVHFAELKEKRIEGLIAHAQYPTSTGKLEDCNNKTSVAKRLAYGFRDDDYFFYLFSSCLLPPRFREESKIAPTRSRSIKRYI